MDHVGFSRARGGGGRGERGGGERGRMKGRGGGNHGLGPSAISTRPITSTISSGIISESSNTPKKQLPVSGPDKSLFFFDLGTIMFLGDINL